MLERQREADTDLALSGGTGGAADACSTEIAAGFYFKIEAGEEIVAIKRQALALLADADV